MRRVPKERFGTTWLEKRMHMIERNGKSKLEQKLLTLASRDNGIKTDVVCCCHCYGDILALYNNSIISIEYLS